jgi:hypothetical protein
MAAHRSRSHALCHPCCHTVPYAQAQPRMYVMFIVHMSCAVPCARRCQRVGHAHTPCAAVAPCHANPASTRSLRLTQVTPCATLRHHRTCTLVSRTCRCQRTGHAHTPCAMRRLHMLTAATLPRIYHGSHALRHAKPRFYAPTAAHTPCAMPHHASTCSPRLTCLAPRRATMHTPCARAQPPSCRASLVVKQWMRR